MGLFSFLSSTSKATENITEIAKDGVKGGINLIDNAFHTDQEKSQEALQAGTALMATHLKLVELMASENSIRSMTRRMLALLFSVPYVIAFIFSCIFKSYADHIKEMVQTFGMPNIVFAIVICYFGYYGLQGIVSRLKKGEK